MGLFRNGGEEGSIIFATSSQKKFRLGDLLRNDGIISDDQAKECFEKSQQLGEIIGKVMVTEGLMNQEMLDKYSLLQVENILYEPLMQVKTINKI